MSKSLFIMGAITASLNVLVFAIKTMLGYELDIFPLIGLFTGFIVMVLNLDN